MREPGGLISQVEYDGSAPIMDNPRVVARRQIEPLGRAAPQGELSERPCVPSLKGPIACHHLTHVPAGQALAASGGPTQSLLLLSPPLLPECQLRLITQLLVQGSPFPVCIMILLLRCMSRFPLQEVIKTHTVQASGLKCSCHGVDCENLEVSEEAMHLLRTVGNCEVEGGGSRRRPTNRSPSRAQ